MKYIMISIRKTGEKSVVIVKRENLKEKTWSQEYYSYD